MNRAKEYVARDRYIRRYLPDLLDRAGLGDQANELKTLGKIVDLKSMRCANSMARPIGTYAAECVLRLAVFSPGVEDNSWTVIWSTMLREIEENIDDVFGSVVFSEEECVVWGELLGSIRSIAKCSAIMAIWPAIPLSQPPRSIIAMRTNAVDAVKKFFALGRPIVRNGSDVCFGCNGSGRYYINGVRQVCICSESQSRANGKT